MSPETIDNEVAQEWRDAFLQEFSKHDELDEISNEVLTDDVTLQKLIAPYENVQVWLLNSDGPLQAYYSEKEAWGDTHNNAKDVAAEIEKEI